MFDSFKLFEGLSHPCIVVDVQPAYSGQYHGRENSIFAEIIQFVTKQTGPVLMFVNAEDQSLTDDTIDDIKEFWEEHGFRDWERVQIVDKGYGYFRSWMDLGASPNIIIRVIRLMYQENVNDSRMLFGEEDSETYEEQFKNFIGPEFKDWMLEEPIITKWTSIAQLKKFSGAYLVGGGRNACLREVEILMSAFNIKYKRIDSLVYG